MDLITLILGVALLGFLVWLITTKIPMDPIFVTVIYVIVAVAVIFFVLRQFGGSIPNILR